MTTLVGPDLPGPPFMPRNWSFVRRRKLRSLGHGAGDHGRTARGVAAGGAGRGASAAGEGLPAAADQRDDGGGAGGAVRVVRGRLCAGARPAPTCLRFRDEQAALPCAHELRRALEPESHAEEFGIEGLSAITGIDGLVELRMGLADRDGHHLRVVGRRRAWRFCLTIRIRGMTCGIRRSSPGQKRSILPLLSPSGPTFTSNAATRRRRMPKTPKNSFRNVCFSEDSRVSSFHFLQNASARARISWSAGVRAVAISSPSARCDLAHRGAQAADLCAAVVDRCRSLPPVLSSFPPDRTPTCSRKSMSPR